MSVIIKLLSKFDDSGLKKAKSGFGGLTKSLGAIGIGIGLKQITDGLLDAAKAASVDAKSMQLLNNQLTRNTGATKAQVAQNNKFIDSLALQVGIADDQLRPAQARLARATGSTAKSQKLLKLALDASAVSGRPLESVSTALAKAFNGNTTSLKRMFPELSKSKDIIGDLTKAVKGAAQEQADPFARMNVAFGELQEKLGAIILPYLLDFIDTMMMPGGAIDQVGKFLEDVSNPKTEVGQTFIQVKDAIGQAIESVKTFFGFFGDGDAVKGFGNVMSALLSALPALVALKGIMMLASAGKAIQSLVTAMAVITGKNTLSSDGTTVVPGSTGDSSKTKKTKPKVKGKGIAALAGLFALTNGGELVDIAVNAGGTLALANPVGRTAASVLTMSGDTRKLTQKEIDDRAAWDARVKANPFKTPSFILPKNAGAVTNNVTINVQGGDPKVLVDTLGKYVKQNGGLPFNLGTVGKKP
jgi:hypothetical protein